VSTFLKRIEDSLIPLAEKYNPIGSAPVALAHQWAHAISTDTQLYAENLGVKKKKILDKLRKDEIFTDVDKFKKQLFNGLPLKPNKDVKFTFIDLFAGIGGMRLGAQKVGGACVFSSEFDKFSQSTYLQNYREMPFGDIKNIDEKCIPDHDLLIAGFPCQPFSYAGKCEGFEDQTRGTLFFDVLRIIEEKKPKAILLENVKGFKSHQQGKTMNIALNALKEAGYHPQWKIVNSYDFGIPQYRERWYCIATREPRVFEFPIGQSRGSKLRDIVDLGEKDKSLTLSKFEIERIEYHFSQKQIRVQHDSSKYEPHTKKGRHGVFSFQKADGALRFHIGDVAKTQIQEAFYACLDTYAPTIIANRTPKLWDIKRKLSVLESSRLQGFPDSFVFNVSNAQAYKQLGNSVTVPVIEAILKSAMDILTE
jgi:DNA (cytosine-5)-methyltransferase 1